MGAPAPGLPKGSYSWSRMAAPREYRVWENVNRNTLQTTEILFENLFKENSQIVQKPKITLNKSSVKQ